MKLFTEDDFLWKIKFRDNICLLNMKGILSWLFFVAIYLIVVTQTALKLFVVEHKWNWKAHIVDVVS